MRELAISIENITVLFGENEALDNISLAIEKNDFLGIIGPNGAGKTTLLKVILGMIKPDKGRISILGGTPADNRKYIGYIPQHSQFDPDFPINAFDVVLMGRFGKRGIARKYTKADLKATEQALDKVGMLTLKNRQIGKLSGGEQQRVFIARALVSDPQILLLDEPTASIDVKSQTDFYDLLEESKQKMTIILVSHDIGVMSVYVDKVACLNVQLYYHGSKELTPEILEATYKCPVQMIAHGDVPHRVLREHKDV
jgi:zinc transport system ATP-binding protein